MATLAAEARGLLKQARELRADPAYLQRPARPPVDPRAFALKPVQFAEQVLGVNTLTDDQKRILTLLHEPPCRVLVPSAHDVGKTFIAAVAVLYWHYSFDPGLVLTTAPTERDVIDLLWAEVRLLAMRAALSPPFIGDKAPEIYHHEDHYAKGYVSRRGQGFQGRHRPRMLFIKDEANDVDKLHWTTTRTMFDPDLGHAELTIFNPTSTTSQAYIEDLACDAEEPPWHRVRLSALDHPNVLAELAGDKPRIPGAVKKAMVDQWVREWCDPVDARDREATDVEWPPGEGRWYRPGPEFQGRAMGLWPDEGGGVWGPPLVEACLTGRPPDFALGEVPQLGCDTATGKGGDFCSRHGRWGAVSLLHESSNTMKPEVIYDRLQEEADRLADFANARRAHPNQATIDPRQVLIKIDDDGTGGAVAGFLRRAGYRVIEVGAGCKAAAETRYPNKRSELWFQTAEKARKGLVHLAGLPAAVRRRLRQQLLAPAWERDGAGRRVVEPKEITKEKLGRSPDDADALNLAYYDGADYQAPEPVPQTRPPNPYDVGERQEYAGPFGRARR